MTEGAVGKHIILFALPLLLGNVFQSAYNIVDTLIVGKYAGPHALAGVGVATPTFNLINSLLLGLSIGASIMIAQLFGAGEREKIKEAESTITVIFILASLALSVLGIILIKPLLALLKTPVEDLPYALDYLYIIFIGLIFTAVYNMLSGLLRGVGDSKTPLYFLIVSSLINIALDMVFVKGLAWGVRGAAFATVIAQCVSMLLTILFITVKVPILSYKGLKLKVNKSDILRLLDLGIPMSLHSASIALGHFVMQSLVNPFGTAVIDAYACATKVDMFSVMPMLSIGNAVSTFSAQNSGAKKYDRVKKGALVASGIVIITCIIVSPTVILNSEFFMRIFVSEAEYPEIAHEIIKIGVEFLTIVPAGYAIIGCVHCFNNTMSGAGDTRFSMFSVILMMIVRVISSLIMINGMGMNYIAIWWAFPISWIITLAVILIHYKRGRWIKA